MEETNLSIPLLLFLLPSPLVPSPLPLFSFPIILLNATVTTPSAYVPHRIIASFPFHSPSFFLSLLTSYLPSLFVSIVHGSLKGVRFVRKKKEA